MKLAMKIHVHEIITKAGLIFDSPAFLPTINALKAHDDKRDSGYLCILENDQTKIGEPPLALVSFGEILWNKRQKYFKLSQEKACRLQKSALSIVSSWQTRNETEDKYGGAVRAGGYVLSFSGLPELADEAFVLLIATACGIANAELLRNEIALRSGSNKLYDEILMRTGLRFLSTQ